MTAMVYRYRAYAALSVSLAAGVVAVLVSL